MYSNGKGCFQGFRCGGIALMMCLVLISLWGGTCQGSQYKGFKQLKERDCTYLNEDELSRLPSQWKPYSKYAKLCGLKEKEDSSAKIAIISVWVNDYYAELFPGGPHVWEHFPLPLVVDQNFHQVGQLPEIYPMDNITSPQVYYGKWQSGLPGEIRIDVINPAEGGDYYYNPLLWNSKRHIYEMRDQEIVDGRRPAR